MCFGALAECVVEDDDVGPLGVFFPVDGFLDKTVGDVAFFFVIDVIADVVTFLENLPGNVTDQTGEGNKKKFTFVHEWRLRPFGAKGNDSLYLEKSGDDITKRLKRRGEKVDVI